MQFLPIEPARLLRVAAAGSLAPVNLITLFAPNFFGSLDNFVDYWDLRPTTCRAPTGPLTVAYLLLEHCRSC
jgi:hypothetical protein